MFNPAWPQFGQLPYLLHLLRKLWDSGNAAVPVTEGLLEGLAGPHSALVQDAALRPALQDIQFMVDAAKAYMEGPGVCRSDCCCIYFMSY